jgi:hypothetical protein
MQSANELVKMVSHEWANAKHDPTHASYAAFVRETIEQYGLMLRDGITLSLHGDNDGYTNSAELFADIRTGNMKIYSGGSPLESNHPLALDHAGLNLNVIFRAVHDYFGHYKACAPFETFSGELSAYNSHKLLYSSEAIPALYSETVGQLCYFYNVGSFVPIQKCSIIPVRF